MDNAKVSADLPFQIDSLIHYGKIKLKKWTAEEMLHTVSTQDIKYYRGGVLLQTKKPKVQNSDTIHYPDVTGIFFSFRNENIIKTISSHPTGKVFY